MSKTLTRKALATAVGGAFIASMAASPIASAAENPFSMTELSSGYMVAEKGKEGQCGEGKCGGKMEKKVKEGNCGGKEMGKGKEGQCGEGKCGADKKGAKKAMEGSCGEGKKASEGNCGGDKKKMGKEGNCGGNK